MFFFLLFFNEVTQFPKSINCQSTNPVIINDDVEETSLYSGGISTPEPDAGVGDDPNGCRDEKEEKARLISQVLELQNTLDGKSARAFSFQPQRNNLISGVSLSDLSQRVDGVKEENLKLHSENLVLGQYIENLMSASSVFQSTTTPNSCGSGGGGGGSSKRK